MDPSSASLVTILPPLQTATHPSIWGTLSRVTDISKETDYSFFSKPLQHVSILKSQLWSTRPVSRGVYRCKRWGCKFYFWNLNIICRPPILEINIENSSTKNVEPSFGRLRTSKYCYFLFIHQIPNSICYIITFFLNWFHYLYRLKNHTNFLLTSLCLSDIFEMTPRWRILRYIFIIGQCK